MLAPILGRARHEWRRWRWSAAKARRNPSSARLNYYDGRNDYDPDDKSATLLGGLAKGRLAPRHVITLLLFLATFVAYTERVGFSVAYTALAEEAGVEQSVKGTLLSAFYWGYGTSQIPGGWAAQRVGGSMILCGSFFIWSLASLLTPGDARAHGAMLTARVAVGIAQGLMIPATHTLLAKWIPPHEKAAAVSFALSGMYLGASFSITFLPAIARYYEPSMLPKITGACGLAWCAAWLLCGSEAPLKGAIIPLSHSDSRLGGSSKSSTPRAPRTGKGVPWGKMLVHPAVWAIVVNNFTFHYAIYVVMNWLPTYFTAVLQTDLADVGALKAVPYLMVFVFSNVGGWLGDHLIRRRRFSTAAGRKAVNTLGFCSAAAAIMLMPMARGVYSGIFCTSLALAALGLSRGGFSVNHMDIAPMYAGAIMGISNTAGTLAGVIGVKLTGVLLDGAGGAQETAGWYRAFALCSCLCVAGSGVFASFARGAQIFRD